MRFFFVAALVCSHQSTRTWSLPDQSSVCPVKY
jgi:hypothetical protein